MKVGIFGRGRLASAVAGLMAPLDDMELAWMLGRDEVPPSVVDVALDASVGAAVPGHLAWARESRTGIVVGATGWDSRALASESDWPIPVLVAPNFSLAVAYLRRVALTLGRLADLDPQTDLVVLERHHRAKLDAPSGTARLLAGALAEGCPRYQSVGDPSRQLQARPLQIASLRAGTEIGYHEMRLEGAHETIVISHEAKSRELFAEGAIRALRWIKGKRGVFSFDDLASELLAPLFRIE